MLRINLGLYEGAPGQWFPLTEGSIGISTPNFPHGAACCLLQPLFLRRASLGAGVHILLRNMFVQTQVVRPRPERWSPERTDFK